MQGCENIDNKIKLIIDEYILNVNEVCHKLMEGINKQENLNLKTKFDFFEYRSRACKMEFDLNDNKYRLHGRGCFYFSDDLFLNWDFGYRSRWCGINPFILGMTLNKNKSNYTEYYDGKLIKEACEKALVEGEMFEKNGLYHYSIPKEDTFIPDFPEDFDKLVIEHFDDKWTIPRNKVIDRFLRKSNKVHNNIYNSDNIHILRFLLNDKEVYSIPYDDVCYPEKAIEIMTDNIIWNLKKLKL